MKTALLVKAENWKLSRRRRIPRRMQRKVPQDPNVWFGNVENAAAAIVGRETVQYVSNIYKYYIAYKLLVARYKAHTMAIGTGVGGQ